MDRQSHWSIVVVIVSLFGTLLVPATASPAAAHGHPPGEAARARQGIAPPGTGVSEALDQLPVQFEANQGQFDPRVRFVARHGAATFFFTPQEVAVVLSRDKHRTAPGSDAEQYQAGGHRPLAEQLALKIRFCGAAPAPQMEALDPLPGRVNYLIGSHPAGWYQGVPTYGGILYRDLYPHTDLRYQGTDGQLKYDFLLHPGADVGRIGLAYAGAEGLRVTGAGHLEIQTAWGILVERAPVAWQEGKDGKPDPVAVRYVVKPGGQVGFAVGPYDAARLLVIDPTLDYSTFLGATGDETGFALAVDGNGNVLVAGQTNSSTFPTTAGAYDTTFNGTQGYDVFVAKLSADGSWLLFSTFVGGGEHDGATALALDGAGNVVVAGETYSATFPTTPGAYDRTFGGGSYGDLFVLKLAGDGGSLLYSTFVGGSEGEEGPALVLDRAGNAIVTGYTWSPNFPTTPGAYDRVYHGQWDVFVFKLAADGRSLLYGTFVGTSGVESGHAVALDRAGNVVVAGNTDSANFPTTRGAYDRVHHGSDDVFVLKLAGDGRSLVYSTFVGGADADYAHGLALDARGNAVVTGDTYSSTFPTTPGAYDEVYNGTAHYFGGDAFVFKLAADGRSLLYGTFVGGSNSDAGYALALDGAGNAIVTGATLSTNFPTTPGAYDINPNGGLDVCLFKLSASGGSLLYGTYLGGPASDWAYAVALDKAGAALVTGDTASSTFPTTPGSYDPAYNGGGDLFVTKLGGLGFFKFSSILFVADAGGSGTGWFQPFFTGALNAGGYSYDVWDTALRGAPDRATLQLYTDGAVIWAAPTAGYFAQAQTQADLAAYLNAGGRLFITGQDIGQHAGSTRFYQEFLHARLVQGNTGVHTLRGIRGDPIGHALTLGISGGDGADNQTQPSEIEPLRPAVTVFTYGTAPPTPAAAALRVDTGTYKVVYFSFGFEAINDADARATVMRRVLSWLGLPPTLELIGHLGGSVNDVAVRDDLAYVVSEWHGGRVADVSNPGAPTVVGAWSLGMPTSVVVEGQYAYVTDVVNAAAGLSVVDILDPTNPGQVGVCSTPYHALGVDVAGEYAFVPDDREWTGSQYIDGGLRVVDITDPYNPKEVDFYDSPGEPGWPRGVAVAGRYAYFADGTAGLHVLDALDPANLSEVACHDTPGVASGVALAESFAYVADRGGGLQVLDISDPLHPKQVGALDLPGQAGSVTAAWPYAYVTDVPQWIANHHDSDGLWIVDVSDPAQPRLVAAYDTPGAAYVATVAGDRIYIADGDEGLLILRFLQHSRIPLYLPLIAK